MCNAAEKFVSKFVLKAMQERVKHEWSKKPDKLYERICHHANELFDKSLKNKKVHFGEGEKCYIFRGGKLEIVEFREANLSLGCGNGALVVAETGEKFIAETESNKGHPYESYAGS